MSSWCNLFEKGSKWKISKTTVINIARGWGREFKRISEIYHIQIRWKSQLEVSSTQNWTTDLSWILVHHAADNSHKLLISHDKLQKYHSLPSLGGWAHRNISCHTESSVTLLISLTSIIPSLSKCDWQNQAVPMLYQQQNWKLYAYHCHCSVCNLPGSRQKFKYGLSLKDSCISKTNTHFFPPGN